MITRTRGIAFVGAALFAACSAHAVFETTDFSGSDPSWATVRAALNNNAVDNGPVKGTRVNVDNAAVETSIGNRTIVTGFALHIPCNSAVSFGSRDNFTRWYQEDGKTQVFRMFQNDENSRSDKRGAARVEVFANNNNFDYGDNRTNIWSARYRLVEHPANESYAIFQSKAVDSDNPNEERDSWSVQLNISKTGALVIDERREADLTVYPNVIGRSFNAEIRDDGRKYVVYIDGVKRAEGSFERLNSLPTTFRWGMYFGQINPSKNSDGKITASGGRAIMYVSGAQITSVPGRLP